MRHTLVDGHGNFGSIDGDPPAAYRYTESRMSKTAMKMLDEANVVGTPGVGFGPSGEGYIRLTAFGKHEDCVEAMKRIRKWLK